MATENVVNKLLTMYSIYKRSSKKFEMVGGRSGLMSIYKLKKGISGHISFK